MKSYLEVTPKYLKSSKIRSLTTCLGIILATALITTIGIVSDSIFQTKMISVTQNYGSYHYAFVNISENQAQFVQNSGLVERSGVIQNVGAYEVQNHQIELALAYWDEAAFDLNSLEIITGRFPGSRNEIMLEQSVYQSLGEAFAPGNQLVLSPVRMGGEPDAADHDLILTVCGVYSSTRWSIVTGINMGTPALVSDDIIRYTPAQYQSNHTVYFMIDSSRQIANSKDILIADLKDLSSTPDTEIHVFQNYMLLDLLGELEGVPGSGNAERNIQILLTLLIIIVTVTTIYNIFYMSAVQRMRQFGVLRCLGASRKQIINIVMLEAGILSVLAIPAGLLIGVLIPVLLAGVLAGLFNISDGITYSASTLIFAALLTFVTVMLASLFPALNASKSSPMQAVRVNTGTIQKRDIINKKWHGLLGKMLGAGTKIAYMNLWRNKKRFFVTCFSLMMGIVLFITFGYYLIIFDSQETSGYIPGEYSITTNQIIRPGDGQTPVLDNTTLNKIETLSGVIDINAYRRANPRLIYPVMKISEPLRSSYNHLIVSANTSGRDMGLNLAEGEIALPVQVLSIPQKQMDNLKNFIYSYSGQQVSLDNGDVIFYSYRDDTRWETGETFTLTDFSLISLEDLDMREAAESRESVSTIEYKYQSYQITGVINILPEFIGGVYGDTVIMSDADFDEFFGFTGYARLDIYVTDGLVDKEIIIQTLSMVPNMLNQISIISYEEQVQSYQRTRMQILILAYGLVSVLFVIAALNIVNTLGTAVLIRKREYAMLRAVGLSRWQLRRIVALEGLFYSLVSVVAGVLLSIIINFILYQSMADSFTETGKLLPWSHVVIATAVIVTLGVFTSLRPAQKISESNIIEAIRAVD